MSDAITMGIVWHLVGAASAACFYAPFKRVKKWSWETMWSIGGIVSWVILPSAISLALLPHFWDYYSAFGASTLLPVFLFGAMWGIGNINYGLTMRYLGMSMGIGIAIGITLIVGTLMTPILGGKFSVLIGTTGGRMTLLGVFVALIGVAIVTRAGQLKERQMGIRAEEFNLKKGLVLAVICGIFSAGMSFAMDAARPMHEAAAALGVNAMYVALPSYVIIMGGGALVNLDLGEAAKSRVLQSGGDSVKDVMSQNAITYLLSLKAGVNGERVEAENFREALNLGNAALKNTGTGQGQLPDMSAFLSNQKMNGYQYLPGGLILQWGKTPCEDRRTAVSKFPIPFPNECLMVIVCGFQVAGTYQAYTVANGEWNDQFSWNAFYAQSGNIPVLAAAGQVNARFLAIGR